MLNFIGGLLMGCIGGYLVCAASVRHAFLSGRITANWIAESCDRLIEADTETESPEEPRTRRNRVL